VNAARAAAIEGGETIHAIDADGLAHETGNLQAANLILLGFALARLGTADQGGLLFCSADDIRAVLRQRLGDRERMFSSSVAALDLGFLRGKR
jgi:indolepyruvate ferredoxin oxidoreductase beta subunit